MPWRISRWRRAPVIRLLPLIEECKKIIGGEGSRVFELALLLAVDQLPVGIQHGQPRNPAFHRDVVLRHQVLVLFALADVHVHDLIVVRDDCCRLRTMKSVIQHVAVKAPVRSKHDNHALVFRSCPFQSLFNFGMRVGSLGINLFLLCRGLAEANSAHARQAARRPTPSQAR